MDLMLSCYNILIKHLVELILVRRRAQSTEVWSKDYAWHEMSPDLAENMGVIILHN